MPNTAWKEMMSIGNMPCLNQNIMIDGSVKIIVNAFMMNAKKNILNQMTLK